MISILSSKIKGVLQKSEEDLSEFFSIQYGDSEFIDDIFHDSITLNIIIFGKNWIIGQIQNGDKIFMKMEDLVQVLESSIVSFKVGDLHTLSNLPKEIKELL